MDNLKFFANKGPAICTLVYVLPILIPIVVIAFAWFYKPGKDALKEKVNSFLEDPESKLGLSWAS
jgi:ABC-type Fe3+ transport system permease subunit